MEYVAGIAAVVTGLGIAVGVVVALVKKYSPRS